MSVSYDSETGPKAARQLAGGNHRKPLTQWTSRWGLDSSPADNVLARDSGHEYNQKGFGPAVLDKSSENYGAIRGREQQLIEFNRARGTAPDQINGAGPRNLNTPGYMAAALSEFGNLQ